MRKLFKKLWSNDRGNALIIAGAALPMLVGAAGLATDTIQWALWKRQLQRAADSAALAGVYAKVQNNSGQTALQAVGADLTVNNHTDIALLGGYPIVTYPTNSGWLNGVRVQLALQKELGFSSLFMSSPPTVTADATAATIATGEYCVVSLEPTSATGIIATGNGTINLGCGMITNSTSMTAAIATGSSDVNATPIAAVGSITDSDNWNDAELLPFTVKQEDPFAAKNPSTTGCPGTTQLKVNANQTGSVSPGCYSSITFNGNVTMADGVYIIDGGDLDVGAQANVTCNSCTFILTNSDSSPTATIGKVTMNGGAELHLTASTSGYYEDILIYQDRRAASSSSTVNKINGNANTLMKGAFYFPNQQIQINGTAGLDFECAKFVGRTVDFSGNGSINNTINSSCGTTDPGFMGRHVRLVA
jgi:Flp pilus assembly protein TadG